MLPSYALVLPASLASLESHCDKPKKKGCNKFAMAGYPKIEMGNDPPAPLATLGYTINHFAMVVNDLAVTKQFYGDVLGMRTLFTAQLSEDYQFLYMGFPQGGKSGTEFQTGEQMSAEKNNVGGLIEFVSLANNRTRKYIAKQTQTFSHIGLIVPDVVAAQARMEAHNVPIIKRVGEPANPRSVISGAFGVADENVARGLVPQLTGIGFDSFLIVADPDGNLLEIQQQRAEAI